MWPLLISLFACALTFWMVFNSFFSKKWDPKGLHCYVTGGSQGLGLSLALLLARRGANVSIVARTQSKLDEALKELEAQRVTPQQQFNAYSFTLDNATDTEKALKAVCEPYGGKGPDAVFACAGTSKPKFLVDMTEEDIKDGMVNAYWLQAWTAFAVSKLWIRQKRQGAKIVLVSSAVGYISFLGYASYAPGKHALRGLTDTLHSELQLYGLDVHCFFAPTMHSPGFIEEEKTKPQITKKLEEDDQPLNCDQAAQIVLRGVEKGQCHIAGNFITELFRASTRGSAPANNLLWDAVLDCIGFIGIPIWRWTADSAIVKHRAEHQEYLQKNGLVD